MIADALEGGALRSGTSPGEGAPAREAAMVKDLGTRFELKVIDVARELVDTEPALDSPDTLSRLLAEAVLHGPEGTLRGGTTEILRGIVARQLVAP
jgi:hypothetical protein